jgi:tetratricopeptide (TPR) repeat protein
MNELWNYIDDYFNGLLSTEEKQKFEQRCETDEQFADEVALYITTRQTMRTQLLEQKKNEWKLLGNTPVVEMQKPETKVVKINRWYMLAAAASIIGIVFLLNPFSKGAGEMASEYVKNNLEQLSVNMDGSKDSLQLAINFYNQKEYKNALLLFNDIYQKDPSQTDALKFSGLTLLMQGNYDAAIVKFDELAAKQGLFSNPGLFYKALVLLKRNTGADKEEARKLLQQVADQQLEGSKQAAEWIKKI